MILTDIIRLRLFLILLFPMMSMLGHPNDCIKLNVNATLSIDFGCSGRMVNNRMIRVMIVQTNPIVAKLNELPVLVWSKKKKSLF